MKHATPEITAEEHFYSKKYRPSPLFRYIYDKVALYVDPPKGMYPAKGLARISQNGHVYCNPKRKALPEEWNYALAHCLLHLVFNHFQKRLHNVKWAVACDVFVARFLAEIKLGRAPTDYPRVPIINISSEEQLYDQLVSEGIPSQFFYFSMAGIEPDFFFEEKEDYSLSSPPNWPQLFAEGLSDALENVVRQVGFGEYSDSSTKPLTMVQRAKQWFIDNYPLLGALASSFAVIEDPTVCRGLNISVAAISEDLQEIYFNPMRKHTEDEYRFIMAHELLHAGLRHQDRCQGRDPYLWNIACDFVINGWLVSMGVGQMPSIGILYDETLKNLSVEEVYRQVSGDIRRYRKLATLRGIGLGDMLEKVSTSAPVTDLDTFCREAMLQGLMQHQGRQRRGILPAGLIEAIYALAQPPIPWDVELARWFDSFFAPLEKKRSYARPSRRQSATPDIARPSYMIHPDQENARTFGVVLDTSSSMEHAVLAKALGAIASYAIAREVPLVRVIFCDAAAYDEGYMPPEDIAGRVRIKGRGGTVLQPGITLLEQAKDFPPKGPVLIITDGDCDKLSIRREHAFLLPKGKHLPFSPWGKVFRFS